ncbi:MAG: DUF3137 domain-containing protein [Oscillospiraceae bacterium]|nr:DUF3137 domain-containing protein [Oscillospiraceae bacterium]
MRGIHEELYNKFLHGLDNNHINSSSHKTTKTYPPMDERELNERISSLSSKYKQQSTFVAIFMVIGICCTFYADLSESVVGALVGIPLLIIGVCFVTAAYKVKKELKCIVSNHIVRGVLSEKFELTTFMPGSHIGQNIIIASGLFPQAGFARGGWNRISGSDLVAGIYKGVRFNFSDLHLQEERGSGKNRTVTTIFKGQWLTIEYKKELPAGVTLRARGGGKMRTHGVGKRAKSDIETENIEFNQKFQIQTRDPHTAFYVLTPHFMEYILRAKQRAGAQAHMNFGTRQVHIALHNGRDLFEPTGKNLFATNNIATLKMQMQWDVNYITNVIDELLLNENLFGKEG